MLEARDLDAVRELIDDRLGRALESEREHMKELIDERVTRALEQEREYTKGLFEQEREYTKGLFEQEREHTSRIIDGRLHAALQPMWTDLKAALHNFNERFDRLEQVVANLAHQQTKQRKWLERLELDELRADVDAIKEHLGVP